MADRIEQGITWMINLKVIFFAMALFSMAPLVACGSGDAGPEQASAESIMDQPLDGSSAEAFEAGMEKVKAEATPSEYSSLENSIGYLLYYDLSARGDKSRLYNKLDGKSPNEIIAKSGK